jgi:hypothetical protein
MHPEDAVLEFADRDCRVLLEKTPPHSGVVNDIAAALGVVVAASGTATYWIQLTSATLTV